MRIGLQNKHKSAGKRLDSKVFKYFSFHKDTSCLEEIRRNIIIVSA